MDIQFTELSDVIGKVTLTGKLDLAGTAEIELKFLGYTAARKKTVLVDLSGVDFIASIGIRMLVSAAKSLGQNNARMILFNPQKLIRDVLITSGVDYILPNADSETSAIQMCSNS